MAKRKYKTNAGNVVSTQARVSSDADFALVRAGHEAAERLLSPSAGVFNVGEVANYCRPGFERHGAQVEIVEGYQLHQVAGEQAPSMEYCWGYLVRELGGQPWFCPAYALRGPDNSIRHIRLVSPEQQPAGGAVKRDRRRRR